MTGVQTCALPISLGNLLCIHLEKDADITEKISMISKPTLVACGRQDMNLSEAKRISKILPVSKLEIMEMTGHGSPFFRPSLVVEIVKNFYITNKLKK